MRKANLFIPTLLGAGGLVLYLRTMAPSVATIFDDSLEFQLVCPTLRIAHPPGYPLYTLLGWLFSHPPGVDPAWGVNLLSVVAGAGTLVALYFLARLYSPKAAFLAPLYLALSPVFWSQATIAEVYTLHALIVALALYFILRATEDKSFLPWAAFVVGLGLAHHRTSVFLLLPLTLALWGSMRRSALLSAFALSAPLAFYLYIPLRGMAVSSLDGTYRNTLEGFIQWVTVSSYGVFLRENPLARPTPLNWHIKLWLSQFGPVGIALGIIGLARLKSQRGIIWWLAFVTFTLFGLIYRVPDPEVFFIPSFMLFSVAVSVGGEFILSLRWRPVGFLLLAMASLLPIWAGASHFHELDRSRKLEVYALGASMVSSVRGEGAVVVGLLGESTLMRYFQEVYHLNPTVSVVAADREEERLRVVKEALGEGRPVYLTRPLPGLPEHYRLWAQGSLIRVWESPPPEIAPERPVGVEVVAGLRLEGYEVAVLPEPPRRWPVPSLPPRTFVNLYWRALKPLTDDLKISVRFYDSESRLLAQNDKVPVHFAYPMPKWKAGELIVDAYEFNLKPEGWKLVVIVYDPSTLAERGRIELQP